MLGAVAFFIFDFTHPTRFYCEAVEGRSRVFFASTKLSDRTNLLSDAS